MTEEIATEETPVIIHVWGLRESPVGNKGEAVQDRMEEPFSESEVGATFIEVPNKTETPVEPA